MEYIPITQGGYDALVEEHEELKKVALPNIIKKVAEARSHGDLKENAEYHAAREHQSYLQGRIEFLGDKIARSQIIKSGDIDSDAIIFGSKVIVMDVDDEEEEEYTLVGPAEADAAKGMISTSSPIGKALIGKKSGDIVEVETPGGMLELKVVSFS